MGHTGNDTLSAGLDGVKIKPTLLIGIVLYLGYLAVFFSVWIVNKVDYMTLGNTLESTKLHYAYPTLAGSLFLAIALTVLGWWRPALFDNNKSGPKWALILPVTMLALSGIMYAGMNPANASTGLVVWSLLGALGVGFGEEVATRGALLVGLRNNMSEGKVWFWSTVLFSALHAPNGFFGMPWAAVPVQLVLTFIVGSGLYVVRRMTGTLIWPILLHGLWDSAIFLPRATGAAANVLSTVIYPVVIVCAIAVIRKNWNIGKTA